MRRTAILAFTISLLLGMFQSCGPIGEKAPPHPSDIAFKPYVDEFEYYLGRRTNHTPIYFANLPEDTAGVCHYVRIGDNGPIVWGFIEIDKPYWDTITEFQKINLIFHELGHCVLGRGHEPWGNSVTICPSSFMYDTVLSAYCAENNYDAYIKEMFPNWSGK